MRSAILGDFFVLLNRFKNSCVELKVRWTYLHSHHLSVFPSEITVSTSSSRRYELARPAAYICL